MTTATLSRTVKRLMASIPGDCPACRHWPAEITLHIVTVVVSPGDPLPPADPDEKDPGLWGPCEVCGRTLRSKVVALEEV
jgi:hypothetical protein